MQPLHWGNSLTGRDSLTGTDVAQQHQQQQMQQLALLAHQQRQLSLLAQQHGSQQLPYTGVGDDQNLNNESTTAEGNDATKPDATESSEQVPEIDHRLEKQVLENLEKSIYEYDDNNSGDSRDRDDEAVLPPSNVPSISQALSLENHSMLLGKKPSAAKSTGGSKAGCKSSENDSRFKPFHEEKWSARYKELLGFHKENGHAAVPHTYPKNPQLARWVKRQRRQYKLMKDGKASTMTNERLDMLDSVGFIWDSHDVTWREKLADLVEYRNEHGHCNVPSTYKDKKLATWVKCQRRQYKLYWDGKPSAMNPERILELEKVGLEWEIRTTSSKATQDEDYEAFVANFS